MSEHLERNDIHDWLDGETSSSRAQGIVAHLDACPDCQEAHMDLVAADQSLRSLRVLRPRWQWRAAAATILLLASGSWWLSRPQSNEQVQIPEVPAPQEEWVAQVLDLQVRDRVSLPDGSIERIWRWKKDDSWSYSEVMSAAATRIEVHSRNEGEQSCPP